MKILKPGKVEQKKFTCPKCGCEFVVRRTEMMWTIYGLLKCCPTCDENHNWENGKPYEEPVQDYKAMISTLSDMIYDGFSTDEDTATEIAAMLVANGVTFREA